MNSVSIAAVKAAEEVFDEVNKEYKSGIYTYTEMKTAINNAAYVARKVCEFCGDDYDKIRDSFIK